MKDFKVDPQQMERMQKWTDQLREQLDAGSFNLNENQMSELRWQLDRFEKQMEQQLRALRGSDLV